MLRFLDTKHNHALPETFKLEIEGRGSFKTLVIDGDLTDYRPDDAKQAIASCALKARQSETNRICL